MDVLQHHDPLLFGHGLKMGVDRFCYVIHMPLHLQPMQPSKGLAVSTPYICIISNPFDILCRILIPVQKYVSGLQSPDVLRRHLQLLVVQIRQLVQNRGHADFPVDCDAHTHITD